MKKLLFVLTALVLLLSSCEELLEADLEPEDYLFEGVSMVETDDPDFDYIVNDEDGNMVYFSWNENYVTNVICRNTDEDWVEIEFNSSAIPEYIYSNDYIVMIDNYLDGVADFAVININSSEIFVYREIDFDLIFTDTNWFGELDNALRYAANSIDIFSQITQSLFISNQTSLVSAIEETEPIWSVLADFDDDEFEDLEDSFPAFGIGLEELGFDFDDIQGCLDFGNNIFLELFDIITFNADLIQSAGGILFGGYGDIQVTLTWDNTADLDLYVTDPNNEEISYMNTTSESGGWLDVDDMDGFGPENIFWEDNQAPQGLYFVGLDYYSGFDASNYTITVSIGSSIETYSGLIEIDENIDICSFNYSPGRGIEFINIDKHRIIENRPNK